MNCWGSKPTLHAACQPLCICGSDSVQGIEKAFTAVRKKKSLSFVWAPYLQIMSLSCSFHRAWGTARIFSRLGAVCIRLALASYLGFGLCCTNLLSESPRSCWKHFALCYREVGESSPAEQSNAVISSDIQISALTWMDQTLLQCKATFMTTDGRDFITIWIYRLATSVKSLNVGRLESQYLA